MSAPGGDRAVAGPAAGDVIGGIRIERLLGRGGMGSVHLGHQPGLNRHVAVKVVRDGLADDEQFRARFRREAEVAASLEHPHIAPVYDAGEDAGRLYVVMRFLDGVDLRTALARWGPVPPDYAARVVEQVGGALDAAHARELTTGPERGRERDPPGSPCSTVSRRASPWRGSGATWCGCR